MFVRHCLVFFLIFKSAVFAQIEGFSRPYENKVLEKLTGRDELFFKYSTSNLPSANELKDLRKKRKNPFDEKLIEAYGLQIKGNKEGARKKWQEIYLFSEDFPRLHNLAAYNLGFLQLDVGKDEEALEFVEEVINYDGEFIKEAYYLRSVIEYKKSQYQEALSDVNVLLENDYAVDDNFLYKLYEKLGWSSDKIISFLEGAVKRNPKSTLFLEKLSHYYWMNKEYNKAIEGYEKVLKIKPSDEAYFQLATFYDEEEEIDKAFENINFAVKLSAKDATYYLFRGILYGKKQMWKKAITDILKGMDLNPNLEDKADALYEKALKTLTIAYVETREYKEALSRALTLYEMHPSEETLSLRAIVYAYNAMIKESIDDYSILIKKNEKNPLYYRGRAKLYHQMEDDKKAVSDLKAALKLDKKNIEIMKDITSFYFFMSQPKEALPYLESMIELGSNNAKDYFLLGLLNKVYGRNKKLTKTYLEKVKSMHFDVKSWLETEEAAALSRDLKIKKMIDEIKLEY